MDHHLDLANFTLGTRKSYVRGIRDLICHYLCLPEECTVAQIKAFLIHQRDQKQLAASTLNIKVCGLKYYFREIAQRLDLVVKIPNPRIQKYDTEILTIQEVQRLRKVCRDMRQLLIVSILYETGIRVRELSRLRISDFDKHHRTITIRNSKGNRTRVVEYGEQLRHTLVKYCKARGGVPPHTLLESYVDPTQPLTLRGIQHIVRQIVKRSGLKKRISPHTFRHTFAVHFLNAGGTLPRLQQLLGHKHLTTTLHYLKYAHIPASKKISVLDVFIQHTKAKPTSYQRSYQQQ